MAQISKEYGSALFDAAGEHDETDSVYEAAKQLSAIFQENPDYIELLSGAESAKTGTDRSCKTGTFRKRSRHALRFVQLLCERGYPALFPTVSRNMRRFTMRRAASLPQR